MSAKQSRTALASAYRVEDIGDMLELGVVTLDAKLTIKGWNRWMEAATHRAATDVAGLPVRSVFPNLSTVAESAMRQAVGGVPGMLSHTLHRFVFKVDPPPGYERFAAMQQSARIVPLGGEDGSRDVMVLIEDVTERVARDEELRDALVRAEDANQAKAGFLAAMSHELRTPIGAISGYTDLLREGLFGAVSEKQLDTLNRIKDVSGHLLGIIEEILVFARIEAGREELHLTDIDGRKLLMDALNAVEPSVLKKGLQLRQSMPKMPVPATTDVVKVRQVLINLLGNAVKFTSSGFVSASMAVDSEAATMSFAIEDSGAGIPESQCERIFQPFVQAQGGLARQHGGTGLGLAVSRQLARLLGGDVTVRSIEGQGSTFIATLPLVSRAGPLEQAA